MLVTSPISGLVTTEPLVLRWPLIWWLGDAYLIPAVMLCLFAAAASRDSFRWRRLARPTA